MKRIFFTLIAFAVYSNVFCQTETCATIVKPVFSETAKQEMDQKLAEAKSAYERNAKDAEAIIWFGRRTAYLGNYEEAIAIFSKGIELNPADARFYRHRGHRYITVRCFDKAISDLKKAAALFKGKADETEPDGMPNALNIPTSTLQSNTWYHLGLAYYLKGDFKNAEKAYRECVKVSANPDMYVATANWLHLTLRQLKKNKEAEALLRNIQPDMKLIENTDYLKLLLLYKGAGDAAQFEEELKKGGSNTLSNATTGYGLGMFHLIKGNKSKAKEIFDVITKGNQWSSFGFIAAQEELKRRSY